MKPSEKYGKILNGLFILITICYLYFKWKRKKFNNEQIHEVQLYQKIFCTL